MVSLDRTLVLWYFLGSHFSTFWDRFLVLLGSHFSTLGIAFWYFGDRILVLLGCDRNFWDRGSHHSTIRNDVLQLHTINSPRAFDIVSGPVVAETQKHLKNGNKRISVNIRT